MLLVYNRRRCGIFSKSFHQNNETDFVFRKDMNVELVIKFINQTFNQGSAILKIKFYNTKNLMVQHVPVEEKVKKSKVIE